MVYLAVRKQLEFEQALRGFDVRRCIKAMAKVWSGFGANAPAFPENLRIKPRGEYEGSWGLGHQNDMVVQKIFDDGF